MDVADAAKLRAVHHVASPCPATNPSFPDGQKTSPDVAVVSHVEWDKPAWFLAVCILQNRPDPTADLRDGLVCL